MLVQSSSLERVGGACPPLLASGPLLTSGPFLTSGAALLLAALLTGCGPGIIAGLAALGWSVSADDSGCSIPGNQVEVNLQGKVRYQKRPSGTAVEWAPVRGARVEVVRLNCGEEVLAVTSTDLEGDYAVTITTPSESVLRVTALTIRDDAASPTAVRTNERDRLVYSLESTDVLLSDEATQSPAPVDLDALLDCQTQLAGAFNVLEAARLGFEAIDPITSGPQRPLTIFWELGNPEGTFFTVSFSDLDGDGSANDPFVQLRGGAFLPGCISNTDQFDDSIILHEFGHYVAHVHSRDDSPGGSHSLSELLDPRLAWSEGWADFFSALARGDPRFTDSSEDVTSCGQQFCGGGIFNLETKDSTCGDPSCCQGIGSEEAVAAFLWDLADPPVEAGDGVEVPVLDLLEALQALRQRRFIYVGDYVEGVEARVAPAEAVAVRALARGEGLTDPGGGLVPFPASFPTETRTPDQVDAFASGSVNGCDMNVCRVNPQSFQGSSDFFELLIPPGARQQVEAELMISGGSPGCGRDLDLRIHDQDQEFFHSTEGQGGTSRSVVFSFDGDFAPGTFLLVEVAGDTGPGQKADYDLTMRAR